MSGKGFARRVTLKNLDLFSPLLGRGKSRTATDESAPRESGGPENRTDPMFAAAEKLFAGTSFRTGMRFNDGRRVPERPSTKAGDAVGAAAADDGEREEELLMRVRPRRNGTQLQISLIVHGSSFMKSASQAISASDGKTRQIGFDYARKSKSPNLARFEASEMDGMQQPVARFRWVAREGSDGGKMLQYEIFDAAKNEEGKRILEQLNSGIGAIPNTNLKALGQTETVLSKRDRKIAQWYRLNSPK